MSRNFAEPNTQTTGLVTPREGRVSRNPNQFDDLESNEVTPREGRVSRN